MTGTGRTARFRLQHLAVGAFLVVAVATAASGCRSGPQKAAPGATPGPAPVGGAGIARVQQIEGSAAYRTAVDRFIAERRKADPTLRDLALDTPSILRAVVPEAWVAQPEAARDKWALDLAAGFQKVRVEVGIPPEEMFMPVVKVFLEGGGVVAEVWRRSTRHYR
ncbi:MAG: hypothetical protein QME77_03225 [bacterium]|nr:hypothetical protein [bacterium]